LAEKKLALQARESLRILILIVQNIVGQLEMFFGAGKKATLGSALWLEN